MVKIYEDYQDEPEDIFRPLPARLYCQLYHLELKNFTEDIAFFQKILPGNGNILEMGCGTGRVTKALANSRRNIIGIDTSVPMLQMARKHPSAYCNYVCMDMVYPAFSISFDTILIPYNTLNLLYQTTNLKECLHNCHTLLRRSSKLIAQIFVPSAKRISQPQKTFQFQLFDRPEGGKIVKEIMQQYLPKTQTMAIEERFRIRPMQEGKINEDYHSIYTILAWNKEQWVTFFADSGFSTINIYGDYSFSPYKDNQSTCLLIILKKI